MRGHQGRMEGVRQIASTASSATYASRPVRRAEVAYSVAIVISETADIDLLKDRPRPHVLRAPESG